jgi:hypothetical protein
MDCHPAAICQESSYVPEGFTCKCRDGYIDKSAELGKKPGRECEEQARIFFTRANWAPKMFFAKIMRINDW